MDDQFSKDVEAIKIELADLESLKAQLQASHEQSTTLYDAKAVKELGSIMDAAVSNSLEKAKRIKILFEGVIQRGGDEGTIDVSDLKKILYNTITEFHSLKQKIGLDYSETIESRYNTVTGEILDKREHQLMAKDVVMEIRERNKVVREMERKLGDLRRVFRDMSIMVPNGDQGDIESQVTITRGDVGGVANYSAKERIGNYLLILVQSILLLYYVFSSLIKQLN